MEVDFSNISLNIRLPIKNLIITDAPKMELKIKCGFWVKKKEQAKTPVKTVRLTIFNNFIFLTFFFLMEERIIQNSIMM